MPETTRIENIQQALLCNLEVALVAGADPNALEAWVSNLAQKTNLPVRWSYINGLAYVVCFGGIRKRKNIVSKEIADTQYCLEGRLLDFNRVNKDLMRLR
jgi:hypothetical protein